MCFNQQGGDDQQILYTVRMVQTSIMSCESRSRAIAQCPVALSISIEVVYTRLPVVDHMVQCVYTSEASSGISARSTVIGWMQFLIAKE